MTTTFFLSSFAWILAMVLKGEGSTISAHAIGAPPKSPSEWRHFPVFVRGGKNTEIINSDHDIDELEGLPLGVPIEFESSVFAGKMLIRLKPVPSDDDHEAYFHGRKRYYQCLFQGKFKEKGLKFSDVFFGDVYDKPFKGVPKGVIGKAFKRFMESRNPGMIYELSSSKPRVLNPIGTVQELSVNEPGEEPDIAKLGEMREDTRLLQDSCRDGSCTEDFTDDPAKRRKSFSSSDVGSRYEFDMEKVYTFHIYDHTADIGSYQQDLGVFKINLPPRLNGQPLSLSAITKDDRYLFRFEIWHEKIVAK